MPHAVSMPSPGFQAFILCGPGVSLNTFTSNPEEFPKALIPIANRPMIWYPLDWCYRMGITNIHLITPPSSSKAIEAALSQNPHLTSLPLPRADVLAPENLFQTSGTADIFRQPEFQNVVVGDFIILPCDLICEVAGESFLEAWMIQHSGLGGASAGSVNHLGPRMGIGGEKGGRRGGLGVWFQTKSETSVKGEETDFLITTPLEPPIVPPPEGSLRSNISKLLYSTTTDTLRDITEEKKNFPIRHGLIRKHGRIRMLTTYRDAHIYLFPQWVLEMVKHNDSMDSISEDVVGWWAKSTWQDGLGDKLGLREVFQTSEDKEGEAGSHHSDLIEEDMDLNSMSTTQTSTLTASSKSPSTPTPPFASRVSTPSSTTPPLNLTITNPPLPIPPMLAYIHPSHASAPLIRRCDTTALLLSISLYLATLPPTSTLSSTETPHPLAPTHRIPPLANIAPRTTISPTSILDINVFVAEKCVLKDCVVGASCVIGSGARLTRCVLMDGVTVGERAQLTGCVLGRRCVVGGAVDLRECEVQPGYVVEAGTEAKGEKFMVFEGLEDDGSDVDGDYEGESGADAERGLAGLSDEDEGEGGGGD